MEGNSFLMAFLKQQAAKATAKPPPVSAKKIASTGDPTGATKVQGIREFAKTKPRGKDIEDYFRAKINLLEAQDSD
jgi:hypothetical protein